MAPRYRLFMRETAPSTGGNPKAARDALTIGQYKPVADGTINATAGWLNDPAITMTTVNANVTMSAAGQVLQNSIVNGLVNVTASNCIIRNCIIQGPVTQPAAGSGSLVKATTSGMTNLLIEDSSLVMQAPQNAYDGILGHDYTAKRVHIAQTTDGCGVYNNNSGFLTSPVNVSILGCVIEKLVKWWPDTVTTRAANDGTHNDVIQIQQGNGGILIRGNVLNATLSTAFGNTTPAGSNTTTNGAQYSPTNFGGNACLQVNQISGSITSGIVLEDNYLYRGNVGVNITDTAIAAGTNIGTFQRNKFDHTQYNPQSSFGTNTSGTMLFNANLTKTVPTTSPNWNTYEDNGVQIQVRTQ